MSFPHFFLSDGIQKLPKLVEDIVQTSINTGPRGAIRLAQGVQAVIGVGGEWLSDVSKVVTCLYHMILPALRSAVSSAFTFVVQICTIKELNFILV